jgi:5'-deoxynucleotidase YfbR-like HD superfamily hydrolase
MSHVFAYLSRMKFIRRWGLMHNTYPESSQEHSLRVAMVAHALVVIRIDCLRETSTRKERPCWPCITTPLRC